MTFCATLSCSSSDTCVVYTYIAESIYLATCLSTLAALLLCFNSLVRKAGNFGIGNGFEMGLLLANGKIFSTFVLILVVWYLLF